MLQGCYQSCCKLVLRFHVWKLENDISYIRMMIIAPSGGSRIFPGAPTPKVEAQTYYFSHSPPKLQKIEKKWTESRARPYRLPLGPLLVPVSEDDMEKHQMRTYIPFTLYFDIDSWGKCDLWTDYELILPRCTGWIPWCIAVPLWRCYPIRRCLVTGRQITWPISVLKVKIKEWIIALEAQFHL